MSVLLDLFSILAVLAGAVFFVAGTVGLLRFPDTLSRLHALTKADNLGLGLIVLGLLPRAGSVLGGIKLLLAWALVLLAGAAVSQVIARLARREGSASMTGALVLDGVLLLAVPAIAVASLLLRRVLPAWRPSSPMDCCWRWCGCASVPPMWR
jgi:multicomponent Na+:H+ antiporter subunit G